MCKQVKIDGGIALLCGTNLSNHGKEMADKYAEHMRKQRFNVSENIPNTPEPAVVIEPSTLELIKSFENFKNQIFAIPKFQLMLSQSVYKAMHRYYVANKMYAPIQSNNGFNTFFGISFVMDTTLPDGEFVIVQLDKQNNVTKIIDRGVLKC